MELNLPKSVEELNAQTGNTEIPGEVPATEVTEAPPTGGEDTGANPPVTETSEPKPEEITWLGDFNKAFNTQYKTKAEVDTLLSRARMADELENKVKLMPEFEQREKDYKEKLEKAQRSLNPLEYFSSPEAFKAEQLKKQFPDKNPKILQDVVESDLTKMDNVEVIIKGLMLTDKELTYEDARDYVHDKYGLEGQDPADWSSALKTKLKIDSNGIRRELETLKNSVKPVEVLTEEQIQTQKAEAKAKREADLAPNLSAFAQFDKFEKKLDDDYTLNLTVNDEFKSSLEDMFKGYFVDGDIEYNEANLKDAMDIRDAKFIFQNLPMVYKAIKDDVTVKLTKTVDEKLGNVVPPASQTNVETEQKLPGFHEFAEKYK